jgi:hypothetical protein
MPTWGSPWVDPANWKIAELYQAAAVASPATTRDPLSQYCSGLRKDPSAYQRGQLSFHFDLEALPWSLRVDDDVLRKRPEIVDREPRLSSAAGMAGHRLGECKNL